MTAPKTVLIRSSAAHETASIPPQLLPTDAPILAGLATTTSPEKQAEKWLSHLDSSPECMAFIDLTAGGSDTFETTIDGIRVCGYRVSPGDFTGLTIALANLFELFAPSEMHICLGELVPHLQYANLKRVFRFVHLVLGRCKTAGATVQAHLTTAAVEESTEAALVSLFDTVYDAPQDTSSTPQLHSAHDASAPSP